ncbi:MAG: DUF86 domain-containing protein [Deltaproteobacteria bacterium]|nr:DUF86 domain-containing protein [Deltaproteobacteria bacterium]MBW2026954.1 DUF86 domain-containing protein [Deltaproteobacteria bacterium]MBW2126125.1 DUF86 domain-containing protein [Deltaproteobacteria bacterium]RLB15799.1 MAG: DUF86 domain-containing protein [Deltaproteobacteria bacterium]RLB20982.1 MAG: DUF86 domain-containing protein [Deltaproteobacteria bacterium]
MTGIDQEKIFAKISDITESIQRLRSIGQMNLEEFLKNQDARDIASFRLIVCTEAAIDICLHLSAKLLKKVPEDYASCFGLLASHNMIEKELSGKLAQMARFRNLLVHRYWEIDYVRLYNIIAGDDLNDLEEFIRSIKRIIEQTV